MRSIRFSKRVFRRFFKPMYAIPFVLSFTVVVVQAQQQFSSFDGFKLSISFELPIKTSSDSIRTICVFAHGSGPIDKDGDFSALSGPEQRPNLAYRDIASALRANGIATVRYDKRSYELKLNIEANNAYANSNEYREFSEHPLQYLIDDLGAVVDYYHREFPKAKILIFGHSEGARLALLIARRNKAVAGVVLTGFSPESIDTNMFEQIVYRTLSYFYKIDGNGDGELDATELAANNELAGLIKGQLPILDLNSDGKVSKMEFMAGNYSNIMLQDESEDIRNYRADEVAQPRVADIIRDAPYKIIFLQGEWDNQTPVYFTMSVQLANNQVWKKENLRFVYFPKAGHILDQRKSMEEITYHRLDPTTLKMISKGFDWLKE